MQTAHNIRQIILNHFSEGFAMSDVHIKELKIQNFKGFSDFEMDNIQQVNLIGGKNNIGKTALLEAIELISAYENNSSIISKILSQRQTIGLNSHQNKEIAQMTEGLTRIFTGGIMELDDDMDTLETDYFYNNKDELSIMIQHKALKIYKNNNIFYNDIGKGKVDLSFRHHNNPRSAKAIYFIHSSKMSENYIGDLYGEVLDLGMDNLLDHSLALFDKNMLAIKQRMINKKLILKIKLKSQQAPVLLSSLGEGTSRYIALICAIWASKDGVLMVDEIENGIHYLNLKVLWSLIFKVSAEANCQVFATTHSKECIEAFNQIQLESKQEKSMYFEMYFSKRKSKIKIIEKEAEQLKYELSHQGRIRGE